MNAESKARGMLFTGEMVTALLDGRKSQTRRLMKHQPPVDNYGVGLDEIIHARRGLVTIATYRPFKNGSADWGIIECPHPVGSVIYVKEKFGISGNGFYYPDQTDGSVHHAWKSSRFMPRAAARIWLRVKRVRVERVQDIGKDGKRAKDVLAEGISKEVIEYWSKFLHPDDAPAHAYGCLWESINGKGSWEKNPFVWVYDLAMILKP